MKSDDVVWTPDGKNEGSEVVIARAVIMLQLTHIVSHSEQNTLRGAHLIDPANAKLMLLALREGKEFARVRTLRTDSSTTMDASSPYLDQDVSFPLPSDENKRQSLIALLALAAV